MTHADISLVLTCDVTYGLWDRQKCYVLFQLFLCLNLFIRRFKIQISDFFGGFSLQKPLTVTQIMLVSDNVTFNVRKLFITGARILRIWSREGIHHASSEPADGIEQALGWKYVKNHVCVF